MSVGGERVVWWIETCGGRVRVGRESELFRVGECESVERASKQGGGRALGGKPEGYVETTAGEKGDVETTARESLPAPRQSGAKEHQLAGRASTRWESINSLGEHQLAGRASTR